MSYLVGVDTGGTFTDSVIVDSKGNITIGKEPSTPSDFSIGVLDSLKDAARLLGMPLEELLRETVSLSHGTTVVTNALLTKGGVRTGLITTKGFEDTILIGRVHQKVAGLSESEIIDFTRLEKPVPIVEKAMIQGVTERVDCNGSIVVPLDKTEARQAINTLANAGAEAIAVCLLWSFANSENEQKIKQILMKQCPHINVALSSELNPHMGEYERTASTVSNAHLAPVASAYIKRLDVSLKSLGLKFPLLIMQCTSGVATPDEVVERPINLLSSGPVGGVMAAKFFGDMLGYKDIVCTDVGGTSFDVSLIVDGEPILVNRQIVGQYELLTPTVDIQSIGTGGGSTAWIEPHTKILHVGPQSAGAEPGPACYNRGGTEPTLTDAAVVLGYINPDFFLGGKMKLDKQRSINAIEEKVAKELDLDVFQAASAIYRIAISQMADLIRKVTIDRGHDPSNFVLFAYGGAGPQYASWYGRELGVKAVVIPPFASAFSAFGLTASDIVILRSTSLPMVTPVDIGKLNDIYEKLDMEAMGDLRRSGVDKEAVVLQRSVDLRFRRQVHELRVPISSGRLAVKDVNQAIQTFKETYERLYGKGTAYEEAGIEMISYTVTGIGKTPKPVVKKQPLSHQDSSAAFNGKRDCYFEGQGILATDVYDFDKLLPGNSINGPAIIESQTTTIVVCYGQVVIVDEYLNLVMEMRLAEENTAVEGGQGKILSPATFEVLRHRLWMINNEAATSVRRISGSPVATESGDFNTGILDAQGNQLMSGIYVTCHATCQNILIKYILSEYSDNPGIHEGDMFLCSDPYFGALHQSDVVIVAPIHWEQKVIGWSGCTIHELDVGGPVPGSWVAGAKSIFEEALPIPPVKIVESGRIRKDLEQEYLRRSRLPSLLALDLRAQIGANNVTKSRVLSLVERYGIETVKQVLQEILGYTETRIRARLKELPNGTWRHTMFIENGGGEDKIYRCHLAMTVKGDTLVLDFSKSDKQAPGSINTTSVGLSGAIMTSVLPLLGYDMSWTPAGFLKAIKVISEPGTVFDALWPAGVCGGPIVTVRAGAILLNVCIGKMFSADDTWRNRATAAWMGAITILNLFGTNQRGEPFGTMLLDGICGGGAARSYADGIDTGASITSPATAIANVETNEYFFPILYLYRRQLQDSGGPGMFRGGVGSEVTITAYSSPSPLEFAAFGYGAACSPSAGICGGYPASPAGFAIVRKSNVWDLIGSGRVPQDPEELQGELNVLPLTYRGKIESGDVVLLGFVGGGGYGDPLRRDPHLVAKDVRNGLVSAEQAKEIYGVVLTPSLDADMQSTEEQRQRIRGERSRRSSSARSFASTTEMTGLAKRIGESLEILQSDDVLLILCSKCKTPICEASENYKDYAGMAEYPVTHATAAEIWRMTDSRFVTREFYCPKCSELLDVEVNLKDAPFVRDIQIESL